MKSAFIVIDGMDGAGKTELIKRLHNYLFSKDKRLRVLTTREPSGGTYGMKIREMLAKEKDPRAHAAQMLDLFIKDRQDHLQNVIGPFLSQPGINIVLCDRYYYSTLAFQKTQGISLQELISLNKDFRRPDLALILDIEPKTALARIANRRKEKFEEEGFMTDLRENFLSLPSILEDDIKIIDASKSEEAVFLAVKAHIDALLDG